MSISFRFDNLEYQRQAVNSVISLKIVKNLPKKLQNYCVPVHSNPSLTISKFWQKICKNYSLGKRGRRTQN